ncbi:Ste24 endopeptidase [Malassezia cuniculi]|uniref:Ste24 endopeptidase n=1 Tax=Malassezia cuniculi TaxID=948313 RepID=A0AAF0EX32_9BASI|nr:Ste24 endopeptidase [Malassezia cuniculi]
MKLDLSFITATYLDATARLEPVRKVVDDICAAFDTPYVPWRTVCLALMAGVYVFEMYVTLRQYRQYALTEPPRALAAHTKPDTFKKSQEYGAARSRFGMVKKTVMFALNAGIVATGAYSCAWALADWLIRDADFRIGEVARSLVWFFLMSLPSQLLALPFDYYQHFVLEEAYGFNKMTMQTFFGDLVISWALGISLGLPILGVLVLIVRFAGSASILVTVIFFDIVVLVSSVIYPSLIQPLFNKLTPLPEGVLRDRITALAKSLKFPLSKIYVIDGSRRSSHSNAYFYGIIPGGSKHIVLFDTLLQQSTPDEIEAVLAHELGHWHYAHPTKSLFVLQIQLFANIGLLALVLTNTSLFRAFGFELGPHAIHSCIVREPYLPVLVGLELLQLLSYPLDALTSFGVNALTRRYEYEADRFAALLQRAPATPAETKARDLISRGIAPKKDSQDSTDSKDGKDGKDGKDEAAVSTAEDSVDPLVASWHAHLSADPASTQEAEPYAELLCRALIKLQLENLGAMHIDPLFSAYTHSHPTLTERLVAISRAASEKHAEHHKRT